MSRVRLLLAIGAGAGVLLASGWVVRGWRERADADASWAAARPTPPDLAQWPAPFRARLREAEARAARRDASALGELAQLYHANGFRREAEQAYRGLLVLDAAQARWPHLLATLLAGYGQLEEAIVLLQRAVAADADYVPARLRLADALLKASRLPEAETAYRAVLARSAENPYAWLGLARIDLATDRLTAAREKLSRAIAADPSFFAGHSLLASVFERLGNDEASAVARVRAGQARRFREASDPRVNALMAFCYDAYRLQVAAATAKATGEPQMAAELLQRALEFAPDDPRTRRQLGACYAELREFSRARTELERAVTLAPAEAPAYQDLAQVVLVLSSREEALAVLARGLERCADKAGLHHQRANLLLAAQRPMDAERHLREAARLDPEKPEIACDLVRVLFELGRERDATAALDHALARNPEFSPVLVLAARHRIRNDDAANAVDLLTRAERAGTPPGELAALMAEFQRRFGREAR